jgi:hypothetical protein
MSYPDYRDAPGFQERGQLTIEDVPTDTEAFLRWGTKLDPDHPYKYELSNGKISRTMIKVTRGHWRVTANILAELFQRLDRSRFQQVRQSSAPVPVSVSAIRTSSWIASAPASPASPARRQFSS